MKLGGMHPDGPSLVSPRQASLFNITNFYHYDSMPPSKFLHTPLIRVLRECFQSGPALAKVGPADDNPESHQNLIVTFSPIYNVP